MKKISVELTIDELRVVQQVLNHNYAMVQTQAQGYSVDADALVEKFDTAG